jgi:thioredoxin 1
MAPIAVSDDTFESEVLNAPQPVVVDFWAEWCGPCRMIAPALEEIAKELQGKVKIVKMNVDENPRTPGQFGIRGIPALLMFKGGKVAAQKVGAQPKSQLMAWITESAGAKVA